MERLLGQFGVRGVKIVINCEPTYTPVRGRYWVVRRIRRCHRNYSEI